MIADDENERSQTAAARGEVHVYERDGLTLAMRVHGALDGAKIPLVCLPGLTRNSRDFDGFAQAMRARDPGRCLIAFDYRGRGLSDAAPAPAAYNAAEEARDVLAGLDHLNIERVDLIGTSRGVIVTHLIGAMAGPRIGRIVFNDAGPRIESAGLLEIRDYLRAAQDHPDWTSATDAVEALFAPSFPALERADFERQARALFIERDGVLVSDYDPTLLETLDGLSPDLPLPELWDLFDHLLDKPLLVLRGEHSGILSKSTVEEMARRHPDLTAHTVPGQGHAPFLETSGLPDRISDFLDADRP
ncbi:alpha/beta hydrolase [Fulvimarina sp. 2208YS6-2-32]|uniref:Alpha/beta hydrolase n=1 Tax=Fulvimarina uroteuthidis TaxID=3098149 RepID=A0ABU5I214_9HYPH|nr:alpha/beta hydrolase [Fulvimarina sp. 2208YS6-2-32]MDY8109411.1 alpha/beta hydrolase [Fulvimarina sp. 2208YS6-2-32]